MRMLASCIIFAKLSNEIKWIHLFNTFDFNSVHSITRSDLGLAIYYCIFAAYRALECNLEPSVSDI